MGTQVQISGTLIAGPADAASDSFFPSATTTDPFQLNPQLTTYNVATGMMQALVNSPGAFVSLAGIGAGGIVTLAKLIYVRMATAMILRLTYAGDATPYLARPRGLFIEEIDLTSPLTLLEVKGSGQIVYFAAGDS